jgi:FAD-dependent urate hydroxylase
MVSVDADAQIRRSLFYLGPYPPNWVPKMIGIDHDVLVVGGGQTALTIAYALRRIGIGNISVIDAAPEGRQGVWLDRARMVTLRTPKQVLGPDLGVPPLTFQAWYEARKGAEAYQKIVKISRIDWADYLTWLRKITDTQVRFETRLVDVEVQQDRLRLTIEHNNGRRYEVARKLVFATGFEGAGEAHVPNIVKNGLDRRLYRHTHEKFDFDFAAGKRIAVLGTGTSAFDAAAEALERDAAEVHMFCRRADLPRAGRIPLTFFPGFDSFALLSDAERWSTARRLGELGAVVPVESITRATRFPNFYIHLNAPWDETATEDGLAIVRSRGRSFKFDFVVVATGFRTDLRARPELASIIDQVAIWADRYTPPAPERDEALGRYPYLGEAFELQPKTASKSSPDPSAKSTSFLGNIHIANYAAFLSFGRIIGDIASLRPVAARVANAISRDLFLADREQHLTRITGPVPLDLTGEEYIHSVWREPEVSARAAKGSSTPVAADNVVAISGGSSPERFAAGAN